jgi:hypothetical protein
MVWCCVVKQVAAKRRIGHRSSMRRSEQLQRERDSVAAFRDALIRLLAGMEKRPTGVTGMFYRWEPQQGREEETQRLRFEVARAAGAAMVAEEASKARMVLKPPPNTGQPAQIVEPIRAWESALEPPNLLETDNVLQTCEQVIGTYDARIARARWQERSVAGRVVRLLSFPYEVRELAAEWFPNATVVRKLAFGATVSAIITGLVVTIGGGIVLSWSLIRLGLEDSPARRQAPSVSSTTVLPTTTTRPPPTTK